MWNRIITLIIKEMRIIMRDKKTRVIIVVPPLLQLIVFAFACTLEVKNISIGILNWDTGYASRQLIEGFHYSPYFTKITFLKNLAQQQNYIDSQKGLMVLVIPNDFTRCVENDESVKVQLLADGRKSSSSQIACSYASKIISSYDHGNVTSETEFVRVRNWYNPNLDYRYFTLPSLIGILCMIMGIMIPALSVAREREFNTFEQILVSPLNTFELLIGKTIPSLIIGILQATVMILISIYVFAQPFVGNLPLLYLTIFIFMTSVIGIGLFISSFCKTQQQAILGVFVFGIPAVLLSGYATPIENMPLWLQHVSLIDPLRYMLVVSRGIFLKAMPLAIVMENLIPMVVLSFVTLSSAAWFFQKKLN